MALYLDLRDILATQLSLVLFLDVPDVLAAWLIHVAQLWSSAVTELLVVF